MGEQPKIEIENNDGNLILVEFNNNPSLNISNAKNSKENLLGKATRRGIKKLNDFLANKKKKVDEHPDNITDGIKEISEQKPLSLEALKLSGAIKITEIGTTGLNLYNHSKFEKENFLYHISNEDKEKIINNLSTKRIEKSLEQKLSDYKDKLNKIQDRTPTNISVKKVA